MVLLKCLIKLIIHIIVIMGTIIMFNLNFHSSPQDGGMLSMGREIQEASPFLGISTEQASLATFHKGDRGLEVIWAALRLFMIYATPPRNHYSEEGKTLKRQNQLLPQTLLGHLLGLCCCAGTWCQQCVCVCVYVYERKGENISATFCLSKIALLLNVNPKGIGFEVIW